MRSYAVQFEYFLFKIVNWVMQCLNNVFFYTK